MKRERKKEVITETTFDRLTKKSQTFRENFDREKERLAVSEMLIGLMEMERVSVRDLARKADVSASIIQDMRSGKRGNPTLETLARLIHSMGGEIVIRKGKKTLATV